MVVLNRIEIKGTDGYTV